MNFSEKDRLLNFYCMFVCILCGSAGVVYWAVRDKIEMAYANGTGQMTLMTGLHGLSVAMVYHDGYIYYIDRTVR